MPTETETGVEVPAPTPREVFEKQAADFLNADFEAASAAPVAPDGVFLGGPVAEVEAQPTVAEPKVIGSARTEPFVTPAELQQPMHKPELIAAAEKGLGT